MKTSEPKKKDQIALLARAIGAIENPADLSETEIQEVVEDLQTEIDRIEKERNSPFFIQAEKDQIKRERKLRRR